MGFGAVEIGSVTPLAQHGNPKPRMFRLLEQSAIINRYGFNSEGLDAVEKNLHAYRQSLLPPQIQERPTQPLHRIVYAWEQFSHGLTCLHKRLFPLHFYTPSSLVGVNLGKNKTSENEIDDYCRGIRQLGPYADYLVINVSSPNTPGLRDLQAPSSLKTLVTECLEERNSLDTRPPLLVKLAPDLTNEELTEIADTLMECGIDGLIVSNTTNQRPASLALSTAAGEAGGLSGPPLKDRSTECIKVLFARTRGKLPIIGVGGISSAHDVLEKLHAGASCVQIYSVLAYSGPGVVTKMRHELAQLLKQQGFTSVEQAVGYSHEEIYVQLRQERLLKEKEAQAEEEETIQALG
jgi:dihydroorotate dehydrogenase